MKLFGFGILLMAVVAPAGALAESIASSSTMSLSYADLADLALPVPVAAHVRVKQALPLKGEAAAAVPAGRRRFYVTAEVVSLIRAPREIAAEVAYLVDLPLDASGRSPKLAKKAEYLLLAEPVPGRPGELRLPSSDAQIAWTPELGERVRGILREAAAPEAPPKIVGIGKAFHVPGTLPGESETQLFLLAANGRPVSLNVLRRPGEAPRWAVALGEIVDEAAAPPAPDTLLWYRLACGLPRALPQLSVADADPAAAGAIRRDYQLVLERLGQCRRNRTPA